MPTKTTPATTPAAEASAKPAKRPRGRPPGTSSPKTGAERQQAYRERQEAAAKAAEAAMLDAVQAAIGDPYGKPAHVILASLGNLLAQLDDPEREADRATLRSLAGTAMRELASRYGIEPFTSP